MKVRSNLGRALFDIRLKTGETRKDMADRFGISRSYLEKIEYGERTAPDAVCELVFSETVLNASLTKRIARLSK